MAIHVLGVCPLVEVFDMDRSLRFYRDVLGFAVVATSSPEDFAWALLRLGDADIMLNTAYDEGERPPEPDRARERGHGDTTLFFRCPDVDAAYDHLVRQGIDVREPAIAPYGMKQLFLRDPDGFGLCFQWPVEASHPPARP
jgi:catechol 2,3-dioxygenase-like lactoylglutathione lyase family enzyme